MPRNQKMVRECAKCRQRFLARKIGRYCSNACRQAAYRNRKGIGD